MPKTNYVPVQGLDPIGGEHPVGVQTRFKAVTGPFIPRSIGAGDGVVTISMWQRSEVGSKHIDDLPVQREDLVSSDHVEVTGEDLQTIYEIYRRAKGDRERLISQAAGYDDTTVTPAAQGPAVHTDADGTVLTPAEVAAAQGLAGGGPSLEEAQAWWDEQSYVGGAYEDAVPSEIAELVGRIPLNEVELVATLEGAGEYESSTVVLAAINARMAAHAEAVAAPGWSPLEDGVSIAEARRRLGQISDRRVLADLLLTEEKGKGRKRHLAAIAARIGEVEASASGAEGLPASKVEELVDNLEESLAAAKATATEAAGTFDKVLTEAAGPAVDEDPFS